MKNLSTSVVMVMALAGASAGARAATATAPLAVTAGISDVCSVNTVTLAFGEVSLTGPTNALGTINVTCTSGGSYTVGLDNGLHAAGPQRNLSSTSNSNVLAYNVYSDLAHSIPWNSTAPNVVAGTGTGSVQPLTVYGQIPGGQPIVVGGYTDTIQVTVTY